MAVKCGYFIEFFVQSFREFFVGCGVGVGEQGLGFRVGGVSYRELDLFFFEGVDTIVRIRAILRSIQFLEV